MPSRCAQSLEARLMFARLWATVPSAVDVCSANVRKIKMRLAHRNQIRPVSQNDASALGDSGNKSEHLTLQARTEEEWQRKNAGVRRNGRAKGNARRGGAGSVKPFGNLGCQQFFECAGLANGRTEQPEAGCGIGLATDTEVEEERKEVPVRERRKTGFLTGSKASHWCWKPLSSNESGALPSSSASRAATLSSSHSSMARAVW